MQQFPIVQTAVMTIVKHQLNGVMPDWLNIDNIDVLFADLQRFAPEAMPTYFQPTGNARAEIHSLTCVSFARFPRQREFAAGLVEGNVSRDHAMLQLQSCHTIVPTLEDVTA